MDQGQYIIMILIFGIWAPVMEEILFRGLAFDYFEKKYGTFFTLIFVSFIFSLVHLSPGILTMFLFGLYLGWLYLITRNMLFPIIAHLVHNLLALLETYGIVDIQMKFTALALILSITGMIVILKKYKNRIVNER